MNFLDVIILSIVEGVTEFLPISSTAHLILTSSLLQIPASGFLATFEVSIQVGAIAAVAMLYFDKIISQKNLFYKTCVAFIPTGIIGLTLYKYIKASLSEPFIPVLALFLGGLVIIFIELYFGKKKEVFTRKLDSLSYKDALFIGLIQSISMIPGVSRAAASIFGTMALRFDRKSAVEFSFLLAIPTMVAATTLDLYQSAGNFSGVELAMIVVGILISFVTALVVIRWLLKYVQTNNFILFGVYRIVLSVLFYLLFIQ